MSSTTDAILRERESLEFLVVCNDYPVFKTITSSIQKLLARSNCAPDVVSAMDYITRRKIDGIVVDMNVNGALQLVDNVRKGNSNKLSVVFVCVRTPDESSTALQAGANFIVHRPLTEEKMFQTLSTAAPMMAAEKKRYFRYPLMAQLTLSVEGREVRATMSNLSEGGMAVVCASGCPVGSAVQFAFELPFGGAIRGKGEAAWANSEGLIGIKFHILHDQAAKVLTDWIARREAGM